MRKRSALHTHIAITVLLAGCMMISGHSPATAQETIGETDIETYSYSGTIGIQSLAYTTTRDVNRKQPLGALLTANMDFSILGFESGLDIRYSTDDNEFRQSLNRFNFFGSWKWVTLSAGDVNPGYGQYALNGSTLRGGELNLSPGLLFIDLGAGRFNRAVFNMGETRARRPSFERWIYALRAGVGNPQESHFSLSVFYGKDNKSSLPDTTSINSFRPGVLSPPAENLGITPAFQLSLLEDSFTLGAETTLSAYTRDQNSPKLSAEEANVPGFLTNLFTPRNSTRLSFAGSAYTAVDFNLFRMRAQYERIEPGYMSMGMRRLRDDQQTITLTPAFHFFDKKWTIEGTLSLSEDNLLGQRMSTQTRKNMNLNTKVRVSQSLNIGGGYTRFEATSVSGANSARADHAQLSQLFQLFPSVTIINGSISHNITLTGMYQQMEVERPVQNSEPNLSNSNTKTASASYFLTLPTGLSINSSVNLLTGEGGDHTFSTIGGSAGAGYALFGGKLNVNLTVNASRNTFERSLPDRAETNENLLINGNFTATYSPGSSNSLQLTLRSQSNTISRGSGRGFSEMEGRIRFQQRF